MNLYLSFSVVFPLCVYILLGILAGKMHILEDKTISQVNKLIFKVLFPVVMFDNIVGAGDALRTGDLSIVLFFALVVLAAFLLLMLLVPLFIHSRPRQGSFIQGSFRANSILFAMPVVTTLCGKENIGIASVCLAVIVPIYNVLSVICLETRRGGKIHFLSILKGIATNPLILGAAAGILFVLTGLQLPELLVTPINALSSIVTPLALIVLGAGLRFTGIRKDLLPLSAVAVIKLVLIPGIVVLGGILLGYRSVALASLLGLSCVPTAVASYPMAEQMGGDGPFAGEIVAFTTVFSMFTVFLWVTALNFLQMI